MIQLDKSGFMDNLSAQELYELAMKHIYGDGVPEDNDLATKIDTSYFDKGFHHH